MTITKKRKCSKLFLIFLTIALLFCANLLFTSLPKNKHDSNSLSGRHIQRIRITTKPEVKKKYILLWTDTQCTPFVYFGYSNSVFLTKKCKWTNCYVTGDIQFLDDYTKYDVIAFNGPQLLTAVSNDILPKRRSPHQKYVYANIESAYNYPVCTETWDDFFNWTWTYKLNSDAVWGYMVVKNKSNHVIAPSLHVQWMKPDEMDDIDVELKKSFKTKTRAAAWFVSSCTTASMRESYVKKLRTFLSEYKLEVYVFGKCGDLACPMELMHDCVAMLSKKYFFYLAFENAISEDYVTEKVLYALRHNTVPIVYGGANYSRYMPDGSYINAKDYKPSELAFKMNEAIKKPSEYHKFFRWKKYYSYHLRHESPETDDYCHFCAMLNDDKLMNTTTIYSNFSYWWTGSNREQVCHPTSLN